MSANMFVKRRCFADWPKAFVATGTESECNGQDQTARQGPDGAAAAAAPEPGAHREEHLHQADRRMRMLLLLAALRPL